MNESASEFPSTTYSYFSDPLYKDILYQPYTAIYYIICGSLTFTFNLFLIIIFLKFKQLRTDVCNYIIIFQCTTELFIGYGCVTRGIVLMYSIHNAIFNFVPIFCTFVGAIFGIGYRVGQTIALLLAFDRFLSIYKPAYYTKRAKQTTINLHVFIISVAVIVVVFLYEYGTFSINGYLPLNYCLYGTGYYWDHIIPFYSSAMTIGFFVIYVSSLILFVLYVSSQEVHNINTQSTFSKRQRKLFISVSLLLLCYSAFYGFPSTLQLLQRQFGLTGFIFNYSGYLINLGAELYGILNALILGTKHHEFRACSIKFYRKLRGSPVSFVVQTINK